MPSSPPYGFHELPIALDQPSLARVLNGRTRFGYEGVGANKPELRRLATVAHRILYLRYEHVAIDTDARHGRARERVDRPQRAVRLRPPLDADRHGLRARRAVP